VVGEYLIDAAAPLGIVNEIALTIQFEQYSGDPFQCGDCWVNAESVTAAATVRTGIPQAHNEVPEPGTWALAALGLAVCGLSGKLRQKKLTVLRRPCGSD
jgi:hypothetical protein